MSLATIGAGLSAAGALMSMTRRSGNPHGSWREALRLRESGDLAGLKQQFFPEQYQEDVQREFAKHGIQWRVEDAKAAGLHPLFALGGGGATYTPTATTVMGGGSDMGNVLDRMGQQVSRAAAATDPELKAQRALELEYLSAKTQTEYVQQAYLNALRAKAQGETLVAKAIPITVDGTGAQLSQAPLAGQGELKRDEVVSASIGEPGVTAVRGHPALREFALPGGGRVLLPAADGGQFPEDMSLAGYLASFAGNLKEGGWRRLVDLMGLLSGQTPNERRKGGTLESWFRSSGPRRADEALKRLFNQK